MVLTDCIQLKKIITFKQLRHLESRKPLMKKGCSTEADVIHTENILQATAQYLNFWNVSSSSEKTFDGLVLNHAP
ncbi:7740_t:CDS:2 [Entrophospora sp. SA101]|nr:7740_t:CDS:2 [Entrophospora sp. SA101]